MQASVRYTAIGSFMPDSISSVAATRSFSRTPEDLSSENTAAASVEPTMAPTSRASGQGRSSSQRAAAPVMPADTSTPSSGQQQRRPQTGAEGVEVGAQPAVQQDHGQRHIAHPEAQA